MLDKINYVRFAFQNGLIHLSMCSTHMKNKMIRARKSLQHTFNQKSRSKFHPNSSSRKTQNINQLKILSELKAKGLQANKKLNKMHTYLDVFLFSESFLDVFANTAHIQFLFPRPNVTDVIAWLSVQHEQHIGYIFSYFSSFSWSPCAQGSTKTYPPQICNNRSVHIDKKREEKMSLIQYKVVGTLIDSFYNKRHTVKQLFTPPHGSTQIFVTGTSQDFIQWSYQMFEGVSTPCLVHGTPSTCGCCINWRKVWYNRTMITRLQVIIWSWILDSLSINLWIFSLVFL